MTEGDTSSAEPAGSAGSEDRTASPRKLFAQRFAELYAAAGNPTLRRVATGAEARMRAAQGNRPGGASPQRISDWRTGRNVPARFESLVPVVLTLADLARASGRSLPRELGEIREWKKLWHAATTWNPEADTEAPCPYPGLTSYGPENRELFFGRSRCTAELAALVRETAGGAVGIIAVVGASGAGKSSLLAAGLPSALAEWTITSCTPGAHPVTALRVALGEPEAEPESDAEPGSESDAEAEPEAEAQTETVPAQDDTERRLLIVDQFEELFTVCADDGERAEFLHLLNDHATRADSRITVVIAVRADFYGHCLTYPVLQDALELRSYLLGPMRMDELAQAISGPARAVGLELEPGLEELVITELCGAGAHPEQRGYDPGALPLLSHVMAATWQRREGRRLTVAGYRKAGGVTGSVADTAENSWNELTPGQQLAAREILLALVTVSEDARDTRRIGHRAELLRRADDSDDATAAVELLSSARLIALDADAVALTHEIVLTAWPRLRGWIDADRVGYLVRQRLEADAADWDSNDREPSLLYSGVRLQQVLDSVDPPAPGPLAREFLTASTTARTRARRRSSRGKAILALLGVILLILGFATYTQTRAVRQQHDNQTFAAVVAEANRLWSSNPALSAQLYLVARQLRADDPDVESKLLQTQHIPLAKSLPGHDDMGDWVGYLPGGRTLASIGGNTLQLWDVRDPLHARKLPNPIPGVYSATFSQDGTKMCTEEVDWGTNVWTSRLWDVSNPESPRELATLREPEDTTAGPAVFLADGRTMLSLTGSRLRLWDISTPTTPIPGASWPLSNNSEFRYYSRMELSPNREVVALIGPGATESMETVQLWNTANPAAPARIPGELRGPTEDINEIAFDQDSRLLAIGSGNSSMQPLGRDSGKVQLWDISDPVRARATGPVLDTGASALDGLTFGRGGRVLATGSGDSATLWNIAEPDAPVRIGANLTLGASTCMWRGTERPCTAGPNSLAFGPDGNTLTGISTGGELLVWSLPATVLDGHAGWPSRPLFDSTGERMVTASTDGRIAVWDARNPLAPNRIGEYRLQPGLHGFALSPDGRTLLVSTSESTPTTLLDLSDPARIRPRGTWERPSTQHQFMPSPDWTMMATSEDGKIRLWDLSDLTRPVPIDATIPTAWGNGTAVFGPGNKTLAVYSGGSFSLADSDGYDVSIWDIADPAHPRRLGEVLNAPAGPTLYFHFTPDLRTMLVSDGATVQSWDISDPAHPARLGPAVTVNPISSGLIGFSADNRTLVIGGGDGTVQLWDYSDPARPRRIGGPIVDPGTVSWSIDFGPGDRILAGAREGGEIRLWDLDVQHAIDRICAITGEMWTPELWEQYLPRLSYDPPCD
ncbi:hypothetical protein JK358_29405 [Nocardia sp. 2]|uniref:Novel STAND NTPase 1 domain-containing protein n=1 Tax=Nocardia acididurans TaxID=2802282 RepID=A0ABS1MCY4_9NOCA|nr:AAA family ATPase [Nocardia acididurans]MBL1078530.1 hypothetical protein [Nocardia acididurans]